MTLKKKPPFGGFFLADINLKAIQATSSVWGLGGQ